MMAQELENIILVVKGVERAFGGTYFLEIFILVLMINEINNH